MRLNIVRTLGQREEEEDWQIPLECFRNRRLNACWMLKSISNFDGNAAASLGQCLASAERFKLAATDLLVSMHRPQFGE